MTINIQPLSLRTIVSIEEQGLLEVMVWPPHSPDLYNIESVWDYMKRQKYFRETASTEDLSLVFQNIWKSLPAELFARLPKGIDAVFQANGGHTN